MARRRPRRYLGVTGPGGGGKTWWTERVCLEAGVDPAWGLVETSKYIIALAELFRQMLVEVCGNVNEPATGRGLLTGPGVEAALPMEVLSRAPEWLVIATGGLLELPKAAFNLSDDDADILDALDALWKAIYTYLAAPDLYREPITIHNKSTDDNRVMLTGVNVIISLLAARWLREHQGLDIESVWPWLGLRNLDDQLRDHPDAPMGALCGLRLHGDDKLIRLLPGTLIAWRGRYGLADVPDLLTERQGVIQPDLRITGEPPVEVLDQNAADVWRDWSSGRLPVRGEAVVIELAPMAARR